MHLEYGPMHLEYGPMHLEYGHLEYAQEVSGCTGSRTAYRSIVRGEKKVRANYWLEGCDIQSHGFCMCCIIFGRYTVLAAGSAVLYCIHMQHCTYIICSYSICICCLHILFAVWGLSYLSFFSYSICELFFFIFYLLVCLSIYIYIYMCVCDIYSSSP